MRRDACFILCAPVAQICCMASGIFLANRDVSKPFWIYIAASINWPGSQRSQDWWTGESNNLIWNFWDMTLLSPSGNCWIYWLCFVVWNDVSGTAGEWISYFYCQVELAMATHMCPVTDIKKQDSQGEEMRVLPYTMHAKRSYTGQSVHSTRWSYLQFHCTASWRKEQCCCSLVKKLNNTTLCSSHLRWNLYHKDPN